MATGKGIEIAEDGVATVGMTEARAQLTSLIREVRYGGKVGAFTERGQRQAYVVTPGFYRQAADDAATLEALRERVLELQAGDKPDEKSMARILGEALSAAEQRVEDPDATPKQRKVVLRRKK